MFVVEFRCRKLFIRYKLSCFHLTHVINVLLAIIPSHSCLLFTGSDGDSSSMSPQFSSPAAPLKRIVPAPDSYVKKKKVHDDMAIVIEKHSTNLNRLTDKITQCLETPASVTTQRNQPEDSLFMSVSAALADVPKENRLSCIIEVLQVVQKYINDK